MFLVVIVCMPDYVRSKQGIIILLYAAKNFDVVQTFSYIYKREDVDNTTLAESKRSRVRIKGTVFAQLYFSSQFYFVSTPSILLVEPILDFNPASKTMWLMHFPIIVRNGSELRGGGEGYPPFV
jgi:hypothetical protein